MKVFVSCDQSTSHCALTLWQDSVPVLKKLIKTGSTYSKTKSKDVVYFDVITNQINFVCEQIDEFIKSNNAELFVMESPSQGSYGDAKSVLIVLFRTIRETILANKTLTDDKIISYSPQAVKKLARKYLPVELQTENGKLLKVEKKHMVLACEAEAPEGWLEGLTLSNGRADYADCYWIGRMFLAGIPPTKKKEK